jgi:ketosteroid isomerase-like protein
LFGADVARSSCTRLPRSQRKSALWDGKPYHNTYTWYFQMSHAQVVKAIAFFDTRDFDEFWNRVSPAP